MASAVCAAIDSMHLNEIVGSIAGDDTIMCAIRTIDDTIKVMDKINKEVYKKGKDFITTHLKEDLSNSTLENMIIDTLPLEKQLYLKTKPTIDLIIKKSIDENSTQNYNIKLSIGKSKYQLNVLQESIEYNKTQQYPFSIPSSYKVK